MDILCTHPRTLHCTALPSCEHIHIAANLFDVAVPACVLGSSAICRGVQHTPEIPKSGEGRAPGSSNAFSSTTELWGRKCSQEELGCWEGHGVPYQLRSVAPQQSSPPVPTVFSPDQGGGYREGVVVPSFRRRLGGRQTQLDLEVIFTAGSR